MHYSFELQSERPRSFEAESHLSRKEPGYAKRLPLPDHGLSGYIIFAALLVIITSALYFLT